MSRPESMSSTVTPAFPGRHSAEALSRLAAAEPTVWIQPSSPSEESSLLTELRDAVADADARFTRFAPLVEQLWPETADSGGIIESELRPTSAGLWLKCDNELPVTASVKSRGGVHAVFAHAERVLEPHGIAPSSPEAQSVLAGHRLSVGSTGNLGLSIGLAGRALGFSVTVHMSADAKAWKKQALRSQGADVVEHAGSFSDAVAEARLEAAEDPQTHFIDDERSVDLFAGYAVAARRLQAQLAEAGIAVSPERPLFVYLPCGVGGAPGGIAFGLTEIFGESVHCVFAEPTHAPAVMLGCLTGLHDGISVHDIGLDGRTLADGLAVQRPSGLVGRAVGPRVTAFCTVEDAELPPLVARLWQEEGVKAEPSACASVAAARAFCSLSGSEADDVLAARGLTRAEIAAGTHVAWLTGGAMMPQEEFAALVEQGDTATED